MQIFEAGEVCEAQSAAKANELLAQGWTLLAVATSGGPNGHNPCYVLGRAGEPVEDDEEPPRPLFS